MSKSQNKGISKSELSEFQKLQTRYKVSLLKNDQIQARINASYDEHNKLIEDNKRLQTEIDIKKRELSNIEESEEEIIDAINKTHSRKVIKSKHNEKPVPRIENLLQETGKNQKRYVLDLTEATKHGVSQKNADYLHP